MNKTRGKNWSGGISGRNVEKGAGYSGAAPIKVLQRNFEKFLTHYKALGTELTAMKRQITSVGRKYPVAN